MSYICNDDYGWISRGQKTRQYSEELLKKAESGYTKAQLQLAGCYKEGRGIEKNKTQAFGWLEKAAKQNYPDAQWALGQCYLDGEIVQKDEQQAFRWYKEAAENGCTEAQSNLGSCYYNGIGTLKNNERTETRVPKGRAEG